MRRRLRTGRLQAVLCALAAATAGAAFGGEPPAPAWQRPAELTARAARALVTAMARVGDRIVGVGERGIALISEDEGRSWRQVPTPVSVTLTALAFADRRRGWATGNAGVVLRTDDGGLSWRKMLDGEQVIALVAEAARTRADPALAATAERFAQDGPDKPLLGVLPLEGPDSVLVYGAYNMALRSDDGGRSWRWWGTQIDNPMELHLYRVLPLSSGAWLAVGEQGTMYRAAGAGTRLLPAESPFDGTFFGARELSDGALVAWGLTGHVFLSIDGGARWRTCRTGVESGIADLVELAGGGLLAVTVEGEALASDAAARCTFRPLRVPRPAPLASALALPDGGALVGGFAGVQRLPATVLTAPAVTP